jgi:hypothetical protein
MSELIKEENALGDPDLIMQALKDSLEQASCCVL